MLIRPVAESDIQACGRIYADAFSQPPYREHWTLDDAVEVLAAVRRFDTDSCWCLEIDGQIAGFAFCLVFGTFRATIEEFAIAPGMQKRGLGTALMNHILNEFMERGIRTVDLIANRCAPAFHLYERFGFRLPRNYTLMAKWLRTG